MNFSDDGHNDLLASEWKNLVLALEKYYPAKKGAVDVALHAQLEQCAQGFLENAFHEIKESHLQFGRHSVNDVVFWSSRFIGLNGLFLRDQKAGSPSVIDIVKKYLYDAYSYAKSAVSYETVLKRIDEEVRRDGLDASAIDGAILETQRELEDHIVLRGVSLKEGDILLLFDTHALGDLAYPMVGVENLMGHAAMIVSGRWGPVKTYYVAEVIDKIIYSKINDYPQSVVVRPIGFTLPEPSATMLERLKTRPFRFDAKFRDNLFDEDGKAYSLYCGEFIHFAYKNGFDPQAPEHPSPFDFVSFSVGKGNKFLSDNLLKLGVSPSEHLFLPEQIFFNPQTEVVGVLRFDNKPKVHPSRLRLQSELESRFYHELRSQFMSRHLGNLSWKSKRFIDIGVKMSGFFHVYDLSKVEFPDRGGQYYFFKLILLVNKVRGVVPKSQDLIAVSEEHQAREELETHILPEIEGLFEN